MPDRWLQPPKAYYQADGMCRGGTTADKLDTLKRISKIGQLGSEAPPESVAVCKYP